MLQKGPKNTPFPRRTGSKVPEMNIMSNLPSFYPQTPVLDQERVRIHLLRKAQFQNSEPIHILIPFWLLLPFRMQSILMMSMKCRFCKNFFGRYRTPKNRESYRTRGNVMWCGLLHKSHAVFIARRVHSQLCANLEDLNDKLDPGPLTCKQTECKSSRQRSDDPPQVGSPEFIFFQRNLIKLKRSLVLYGLKLSRAAVWR